MNDAQSEPLSGENRQKEYLAVYDQLRELHKQLFAIPYPPNTKITNAIETISGVLYLAEGLVIGESNE